MLVKREQTGAGIGSKAVLTLLILSLGAALVSALDLKPATLEAWNSYLKAVATSMDDRAAGRKQFLWMDESPELQQRVRGGEMVVTSEEHPKVPAGMINHWVGAMFIPGATIDQVSRVLADYDSYKNIYGPVIVSSRTLERKDGCDKATFLLSQKAFGVTAAIEEDNEIRTTKLDANKIYILTNTVRLQEIADYGQPTQHALQQDQGPGYVYRTYGITRLEQRDGGVYLESESIALSRNIPFEFRWLIRPLTEHLPRNLMLGTLKASRTAVTKEVAADAAKGAPATQTASHQ
jgi:hypothetical protein